MNEKKRHTILDLQVMNKFVKFDKEMKRWIDLVGDKKTKNTWRSVAISTF